MIEIATRQWWATLIRVLFNENWEAPLHFLLCVGPSTDIHHWLVIARFALFYPTGYHLLGPTSFPSFQWDSSNFTGTTPLCLYITVFPRSDFLHWVNTTMIENIVTVASWTLTWNAVNGHEFSSDATHVRVCFGRLGAFHGLDLHELTRLRNSSDSSRTGLAKSNLAFSHLVCLAWPVDFPTDSSVF